MEETWDLTDLHTEEPEQFWVLATNKRNYNALVKKLELISR